MDNFLLTDNNILVLRSPSADGAMENITYILYQNLQCNLFSLELHIKIMYSKNITLKDTLNWWYCKPCYIKYGADLSFYDIGINWVPQTIDHYNLLVINSMWFIGENDCLFEYLAYPRYDRSWPIEYLAIQNPVTYIMFYARIIYRKTGVPYFPHSNCYVSNRGYERLGHYNVGRLNSKDSSEMLIDSGAGWNL